MKKIIINILLVALLFSVPLGVQSKFLVQETVEPIITTEVIPVDTETPTPTDTEIPTETPTEIPTNTPTDTPTETLTNTPTSTETPTETPTNTDRPPRITDTPTSTVDFDYTPTPTITRQPTATPITPTPTITRQPTFTPTSRESTLTPTITSRPTKYPTYTPYPTATDLPTYTPNPTYTPKPTYTPRVIIYIAPTEAPITTEGVTISNDEIVIERNVSQPVKLELPRLFDFINYLSYIIVFINLVLLSVFLLRYKYRIKEPRNLLVIAWLINALLYYSAWILNELGLMTIQYSDIFFLKWIALLLLHILVSGALMTYTAIVESNRYGR